MLRIKFTSPLIALIATCGIAGLTVGQSAFAADLMERPGGGGGGGASHGPGGGAGHPGGGGGHNPAPGGGGGHNPAPGGGGGHNPAPGGGGGHNPAPGGGGFGGGHGPAPGGNPGYHPPAPTPGGGHGPTPGGNPGYHPPAPTPGGGFGGGGHNPGPAPGGNPGYHPPAPTPGGGFGGGGHNPGPAPGGHGPTPGGNPGYHPPAPGGNPGYHPPAPTPGGGHGPTPGGNPGYHPPAPTPGGGFGGGGHTGGGYPGGGYHGNPGNHGNPGAYHGGIPVGHAHGPGYSYGHDNHGNIVSPVYQNHIDLGRRRMDDMRRDSHVRTWVDQRGAEFRDHYHPVLINYNDRFVRYHDDYRERFRPWWNEGFYGGCYWGFHPFYDIDSYFYDPMVYWFYVNNEDDAYYRTWYGNDFDRYPVFRTHNRYVRAFYPTEEFRDMNLGISALSIDTQAQYLQASTVFGDRLAEELKARGGSGLDEESVVVDHYQVLPDDKGVVVEGFVDQDDVQFAFKAVQDFSNPNNTTVFTASADQDVSSDNLDQLRQLNTRIEDMGGVAESDEANDGTVTAPSDDGTVTPPSPPSDDDQNTGASTPTNSDDGQGQTSDWDDQNSSG